MIRIRTVTHAEQRYNTVGDWRDLGDGFEILVSDLGDWRMNLLVGLHELIEAALCKHRGISDEVVTAFDKKWATGLMLPTADEPGDEPTAPYHTEHRFASLIEGLMAVVLEVDWTKYERAVDRVSEGGRNGGR